MVSSRLAQSIILSLFLWTPAFAGITETAYAIVDPLKTPNNKFGIHIISASTEEASGAASLVNSSGGDWGYVTFLIEAKNRDVTRWQKFFDELRVRHLIPIVRVATNPVNAHWERPYEKEPEAVADFLNNLIWPTKNRYVVVYNEPNHGSEWGQVADPASYAKVLNNTIDALKKKSEDFFVLNGGFDASAPHQPPRYFDQEQFMVDMEKSVPGIFNKLDGWSSHSYPNPNFSGSPDDTGRGTIKTFQWEMEILKSLGVNKNLPVFITETGWKHAEGLSYGNGLPSSEDVAKHYKRAFESWDPKIVAVTPFLLDYQEAPFDHFSFKQLSKNGSVFYPQYHALIEMQKTAGKPIQEYKAQLIKGEVYSSVVAGESYEIRLLFKNTGQAIWDKNVKLVALQGGNELGIKPVGLEGTIEPGKNYTFTINLKAPQSGSFKVSLVLLNGLNQFTSPAVEFNTEVKSPVMLVIHSLLRFNKDPKGDYLLTISGPVGETTQNITLDSKGQSPKKEARFLLPGYSFDFTLERSFYKPKTIHQEVQSGVNTLNFGELEPDILKIITNPLQLWRLLPF